MHTRLSRGLLAGILSLTVLVWGGPAQAYLSPGPDYAPGYVIGPGSTPDYLTTPNWANSPRLRKFQDALPGIPGITTYNTIGSNGYNPDGTNLLGQAMPAAVPDIVTYPGSDYYEIELREFTEKMHSDLPNPTRLRAYRQVNAGTDRSGCSDPGLDPLDPNNCTSADNTVAPPAVPHHLGPIIIAQKDRPVRVKFINNLPTGSGGDLFIPVDTTIMGAGPFNLNYDPATREYPLPDGTGAYPPATISGSFTQNRATLHLHGGKSPWVSDGTPHQWITPAGEATVYPEGVSKVNVSDMPDPGPGAQTFYWTNQQSARLMFYHDHAWGITRLNVYAGEAAGYMIQDPVELQLTADDILPAEQIPLIIQDKTFVDADPSSPTYVHATDPTWNWGSGLTGDLWWPHVYMPAQNPFDITGIAPMGRWAYGPYFWPATNNPYQPVPNPYYNPDCEPTYDPTPGDELTPADIAANEATVPGYTTINGAPFCQPPEIPGTPNPSWGAEAFMDTPTVNGTAYPVLTLEPKAYRFRILNAAHDRFLNLSLFKADTAVNPNAAMADDPATPMDEAALTTASAALCNPSGEDPLCASDSEVRMLPATTYDADPTWPATWPADGREGGVPDWNMKGPDWIMIGTEGGFLPRPVVIPPHPVTWNNDVTTFNAGNVNGGSLILGPAERADVIVDFSSVPPGTTLILYNDAPAPWPALDPHYDYYTGAPDNRDMGGADTTLPGFGPNIRTIMQIRIEGTPAAAYDASPSGPLFAAFTSTGPGTSVFQRGQDPIIAAQGNLNPVFDPARFEAFLFDTVDFSAYNKAYNSTFPTTYPNWGISRINDKSISFKTFNPDGTLNDTPVTVAMKAKAIQDEQGETFDDYGRMRAALGLELLNPAAGQVNFIVQTYSDPATEIINPDEIQVWKITHNGVDTHPVHFHLYDVQVLNRVGWDGFIRLPDPTELGWKDTVRISPLEDTIVALRPSKPALPFGIPTSARPLNPATPLGDNTELSPVDPNTGQAWASPNLNRVVGFGWEYVWHCHILSHEENDMMRSQQFNVVSTVPAAPALFAVGTPGSPVELTWTDGTPASDPATMGNPANEIGFRIERALGTGAFIGIGSALANVTTFTDTATDPALAHSYRVVAFNDAGEAASYIVTLLPQMSLAAPVDLTADRTGINEVRLTWTDLSAGETDYRIELATDADGVSWTAITTGISPAGPLTSPGTGGVMTVTLTGALTAGVNNRFRVAPMDGAAVGPYSNVASIDFTVAPAAPGGLNGAAVRIAGNFFQDRVTLNWTDNSSNEFNFQIQRATIGGTATTCPGPASTAWTPQGTVGVNVTTFGQNVSRFRNYCYRVRATNGAGVSAWTPSLLVTTP